MTQLIQIPEQIPLVAFPSMLGYSGSMRNSVSPFGDEYYVFRDAVHNLIEVANGCQGRALRAFLRTKEMQRLRRIRQNGLASLVYSSLENSRFAHSLGTFAVAQKAAHALSQRMPSTSDSFPECLTLKPPDAFAFATAALLHDIGHAPFSHVWEDYATECASEFGPPRKRESVHEQRGRAIVSADSTEIGRALRKPHPYPSRSNHARLFQEFSPYHAEKTLAFLNGDHPLQPLVTLLSGPVDVDRLDFMGRDTRGAGVTYGFHELEWILRSLRYAELPRHQGGPAWVVAIDGRKGLTTLAQFLYARANMYRLVYLHKTVRAAGCMLLRILRRARTLIKDGVETGTSAALLQCIKKPFDAPLEDFLDVDDSDVWCALKVWARSQDTVLMELSNAFLSRQLFKVFELDQRSANILRKLDSADFGHRLQSIVAHALEISAEKAPYYYGFDETEFYLAGREFDEPHKKSWILQRGRFGWALEPLRDFWRKTGLVTAQSAADLATTEPMPLEEHKYHLVCDWRVQPHFQRLIESIHHVPQFDIGDPPNVPEAYGVLGRMDAPGLNKIVYIGADKNPGRRRTDLVALKVYRGEDNTDRDGARPNLFIPRHQNVSHCAIESASGSDTWLVECLWSGTLHQLLKEQGPLRNLKQVADMGHQLFLGLAQVHNAGIRHTDIKPDNCGIMIEPDSQSYVIGDFGCCTSQPDRVPQREESLGTLKTRPPELFEQPKRIGIASDVWSLGATMYAMLTLRYPFMPYDVALGPLGSDARLAQIQAISTTLCDHIDDFTRRRTSELPIAVDEILSKCFAQFTDRVSAIDIAESFRKLYDTLTADQAAAWGRAEHIVALAAQVPTQRNALSDEARSLSESFGRYIPPSTLASLADLYG